MNKGINRASMLRVGTILHGTYRIDDYLASGGFGNTYIATNVQFGERYAIKEFYLKGMTERLDNTTGVSVSNRDNEATFLAQKEKFKKEAVRLRKLKSPNIVQVHDLFEENGTAYYVMDFVDGENLRDHLKLLGKPLDEAKVWEIFGQVLDALDVVHHQKLYHLDIKPANLMMDKQGRVMLIDFGASKQVKAGNGATTSTAVSYTNGYAPREQMEQNLDKFGPWTDFYALGATVYSLLTNVKPPLPSDIDDDQTEDKHQALPLPAHVSDKMRRLVLWLMATNRLARPQSVAEIRSFISKSDTEATDQKPEMGESGDDTVVNREPRGGKSRPADIPVEPSPSPNPTPVDEPDTPSGGKSKLKPILFLLVFFLIGGFLAFQLMGNESDGASHENAEVADTMAAPAQTESRKVVQNMELNLPLGKCIYKGEVDSDNRPDGKGEAWFADKRYYKGRYSHGVLEDNNGYFRYGNGDTFEGEIHNDRFAQGKYTLCGDGSYFIGTFDEQGQPLKGTWYTKQGKLMQKIGNAKNTTNDNSGL